MRIGGNPPEATVKGHVMRRQSEVRSGLKGHPLITIPRFSGPNLQVLLGKKLNKSP